MKDIDFDELDRAVNSLMSSVPEDKTPQAPEETTRVVDLSTTTAASGDSREPEVADSSSVSTPATSIPQPTVVLEEESELSAVQEPALEQQQEIESEVTPVFAGARQTPAARRGRFMDVMPSGRDVTRPKPSSPPSRQGVNLQPTGALLSVSEPVEEEPVEQVVESSQSYSEDTSEIMRPEPVASTQQDDVLPNDFASVDDEQEVEPLTSPFLTDAKVEKRPLGRPVDTSPVVDLAAELAEAGDDPTDSYRSDDQISPDRDAQLPEQPLPAELGSELLSIETSGDSVPQDVQPAQSQSSSRPSAPIAPQPMSTQPASARAMAAASIPQQYKVQPASGNQDAPTSAIYDTQPLSHPAKKKPGWLWVVAIIAIILLGAGGGAALYYLGLI